jgi:hypothetical protein
MAADDTTPKKLVAEKLAVGETQFTYAIGKIVLFSNNGNLVKAIKRCVMQNSKIAMKHRLPTAQRPWRLMKSFEYLRRSWVLVWQVARCDERLSKGR